MVIRPEYRGKELADRRASSLYGLPMPDRKKEDWRMIAEGSNFQQTAAQYQGLRPAYPDHTKQQTGHVALGLTKRELFAAMAMQGMLGNAELKTDVVISRMAVQIADELLKALYP